MSTLCSPQSHLTLFSLLYYRYSKWPLFPNNFLKKFCNFPPLLLPCMLCITVSLSFLILHQNIMWNTPIAILLICDIYCVPIYLFIYAFINNTTCSSNYVAIYDRIINEWIGKNVKGSVHVLIWGTILACVLSQCTILACVWNHCTILACVWSHCTTLACVCSHYTILACVWRHWEPLQSI